MLILFIKAKLILMFHYNKLYVFKRLCLLLSVILLCASISVAPHEIDLLLSISFSNIFCFTPKVINTIFRSV